MERLMNRHLPSVLSLAQRMTAHRWRRDGPARFSTWPSRVVVSRCLDRRRKGR